MREAVLYATLRLDSGSVLTLTVEVLNLEDTVVLVDTSGLNVVGTCSSNEGVGDHSVAGLEPDTGLEGILTDRTDHL